MTIYSDVVKSFQGASDTNDFDQIIGHLVTLNKKIEELVRAKQEIAPQLFDEKALLSNILKSSFRSEIVSRHDLHVCRQLSENEKVHRTNSVQDLIDGRVGGVRDNKRCLSLLMGDQEKPSVVTNVSTYRQNMGDSGLQDFHDIPGGLKKVLDSPIEGFSHQEGDYVALILYSISTNFSYNLSGVGRRLAGDAFSYFYDEAAEQRYKLILSTLSPVTGFYAWLNKRPDYEGQVLQSNGSVDFDFVRKVQGDLGMQDNIKALVMSYLLEYQVKVDPKNGQEKKLRDLVLNFHLGNGAGIGDIKFNFDVPEYWVMITYGYPQTNEARIAQQDIYNASGTCFVAPHLREYIDENSFGNPSHGTHMSNTVRMMEHALGNRVSQLGIPDIRF